MTEASNPIDCKHVLDLLDDYRRRALPAAQMTEVESHLQACDKCAAELASREMLGQYLRESIPTATPPIALSTAIQTTIKQAQHPDTRARRSGSKNMLPWMLAAAVVLVVGAALIQMRPASELVDAEVASSVSTRQEAELYFDADMAAPEQPAGALAKSEAAPARSLEVFEAKVAQDTAEVPAMQALPPPMMPTIDEGTDRLGLQDWTSQDKAVGMAETVAPRQSQQLYRDLVPAEAEVAGDIAESRKEAMPGTFTQAGYAEATQARPPLESDSASRPHYVRSSGMASQPPFPAAPAAQAARSRHAPMAAAARMGTTATATSATLTTQTLATTMPLIQTTSTETSAPQ